MTDWYDHKTLYTYDKDTTNPPRSECYGHCAVDFRPFQVRPGERPVGDFTIVKRDDGTQQWAYKGKPLYIYTKDVNTGDSMGAAVGSGFSVIK